jgi:hypothetical protein
MKKRKAKALLQVRLSEATAERVRHWSQLMGISETKVADMFTQAGERCLSDPQQGRKLRAVIDAACALESEKRKALERSKQASLKVRAAQREFAGMPAPSPKARPAHEPKVSVSVLP